MGNRKRIAGSRIRVKLSPDDEFVRLDGTRTGLTYLGEAAAQVTASGLRARMVNVRCACGVEFTARFHDLRKGTRVGCGCRHRGLAAGSRRKSAPAAPEVTTPAPAPVPVPLAPPAPVGF